MFFKQLKLEFMTNYKQKWNSFVVCGIAEAWKVVFEFEICGRCRFCGPRGFGGLVSWVVALIIWWLVTIKAEIRPLLLWLLPLSEPPPPIAWEHFRITHDHGWEKRDTTFNKMSLGKKDKLYVHNSTLRLLKGVVPSESKLSNCIQIIKYDIDLGRHILMDIAIVCKESLSNRTECFITTYAWCYSRLEPTARQIIQELFSKFPITDVHSSIVKM